MATLFTPGIVLSIGASYKEKKKSRFPVQWLAMFSHVLVRGAEAWHGQIIAFIYDMITM